MVTNRSSAATAGRDGKFCAVVDFTMLFFGVLDNVLARSGVYVCDIASVASE